MNTLPEPLPGRLLVLAAPHAAIDVMLDLSARLSAQGPVRVLDGGNRFNAYRVARSLRRMKGVDLHASLRRLSIARAFTCYQMTALLEATPESILPTLIVDFLGTFYDESVLLSERLRLARQCLDRLHRLSLFAAVALSVRPPLPPNPDPTGLIELVRSAAAQVWWLDLPSPTSSPRLF